MIADWVMNGVRDKWESLGAEAKLGGTIEPVTRRFTVVKSSVSSLNSIDLNGGDSWNAVLHAATMPPNINVGLSLPIRKGRLIGVESFLQRIDDYVRLALSPKWFAQFLVAHPDATLEIRFVEDRSLSRFAERRLTEDLTKIGKADAAERVSASADQAVFVEMYAPSPGAASTDGADKHWSRWIVLPNRDMVLWEYQGETVGIWSDKDFQSSECYGWKCVGSIIPESGN
jgi:hypothetical protein